MIYDIKHILYTVSTKIAPNFMSVQFSAELKNIVQSTFESFDGGTNFNSPIYSLMYSSSIVQ